MALLIENVHTSPNSMLHSPGFPGLFVFPQPVELSVLFCQNICHCRLDNMVVN